MIPRPDYVIDRSRRYELQRRAELRAVAVALVLAASLIVALLTEVL